MDKLLFSETLFSLVKGNRSLLDMWWTRYCLIVRESSRGQDCPYARMAWNDGEEEIPKLKAELIALRNTAQQLLDQLECQTQK